LNTTLHVALDELGPDFGSLDAHCDAVQQGLAVHSTDAKIVAKYRWIAGYHNQFCERWEYPEVHRVEGIEALGDQALA